MKPSEEDWLLAMTRLRRYCEEVLFSKRQVAMMEVRPKTESGRTIAYPDAMFYIAPADVDRAIAMADYTSE